MASINTDAVSVCNTSAALHVILKPTFLQEQQTNKTVPNPRKSYLELYEVSRIVHSKIPVGQIIHHLLHQLINHWNLFKILLNKRYIMC